MTESALGLYRPDEEAVVVDSREEGIYVLIVGKDRSETLGEFLWTRVV